MDMLVSAYAGGKERLVLIPFCRSTSSKREYLKSRTIKQFHEVEARLISKAWWRLSTDVGVGWKPFFAWLKCNNPPFPLRIFAKQKLSLKPRSPEFDRVVALIYCGNMTSTHLREISQKCPTNLVWSSCLKQGLSNDAPLQNLQNLLRQ
jgi:hypothetical protein